MKTIILSLLLFTQTATTDKVPSQAAASATETTATTFSTAYIIAWNTISTGFTVTLTNSTDTYTFDMPSGFYNHGNQWEIPEGYYDVTFTPYAGFTYGACTLSANGNASYKYGSSNTGAVTLTNVQLYGGGGNQVSIDAM